MPPHGGRFPGHNLSNPFAHLSGPIPQQQQQPLHQQHQPQNNMQHPGFGGGNQAHNLSLFGQHQGGFQSNAGLSGGLGGAGLGAAAAIGGAGGGTGLDGHEARMRFAHGAQIQENAARGQDGAKGIAGQRIREVWRSNLHQEMDMLRSLIDQYPYISMSVIDIHSGATTWASFDGDTEFPGVVARPIGEFNSKASYHYQTVRCNVDLLKIIQLGITLFNVQGDIPPPHLDTSELAYKPRLLPRHTGNIVVCPCTWSFNFHFALDEDMYNEESIQMLKKSGADFEKHREQGIDPQEFGSLLTTSGMVVTDDVNWISFHSGYDFAYMLKMLTAKPLPEDEEEYRKQVKIFFPKLLDVKYLWRHANNLVRRGVIGSTATNILNNLGTKSGLQDLADELGCQRIGNSHTAGSDAWLTGVVFWEMKKKIFDGTVPEEMSGHMWGLTGVGPPASATAQAAVIAAQGASQGLSGFQQGVNSTFYPGNARHGVDGPSTPTNHPAGLANTPGQTGMMTPGAYGYGNK